MKKQQQYTVLDTIDKCNSFFGISDSHPLVSIINLSKVRSINIKPIQLDLYAVTCTTVNASESTQEEGKEVVGRVRFFSPGHISKDYDYDSLNIQGWILIFHPNLLIDTLLAQRISEYSFFDRNSNGITLPKNEIESLNFCIASLCKELHSDTDRYSRRIIVAGIAVLLSLCMRYAERNPEINTVSNNNIVARLNSLLNYYISLPTDNKELPTVADCARELNISANYLGDLVRKQAGCSAREYIHKFVVNEAKARLMRSTETITDIAYSLGFKYPHHLTRMFRSIEGITPQEYRAIYERNW